MMQVFEKGEAEYWRAVGIAIKKERQKAGIRQEDVMETMGVSRSQIANMETGRSRASVYRILKLAELYKCDPMVFVKPKPAPPIRKTETILKDIEKAEADLMELKAEKRALGLSYYKPKQVDK